MVTVYDVAKATGLSIASVSRALNGQPGVSRDTAERVVRIADEIGYQPNDVARSLVAKSTQTVALLLPDITNPFFPELVKGVQAVTDSRGHVLLLVDGAGDRQRVASSMAVLRRKQVDGVIIVAGSLDGESDELFLGIPTVFLDRKTSGLGASVGVDHEEGGYAATRHLIELGHRRIAHIAGPTDLAVSQLRLAGWQRACTEAGLPIDRELVVQGDFLEDGGHRGGAQLLDSGVEFSAVFAANDLSAIGFLALCAQRGIRVPDELSLIGFDGIHISRYTTPALTTIAQPIVELGTRAGLLLMELIRGEVAQPHIVLPSVLFAGASVREFGGYAMSRVVVIGSLNLDLVIDVEHLPAAGETIIGDRFRRLSGGKGGNQAYAAARVAPDGVDVAMVACVGADDAGDLLRRDLAEAGVDVSGVRVIDDAPSGMALITVGAEGANTIVVASGANHSWSGSQFADLDSGPDDVIVAQLEIPFEVVEQVAELAAASGARFVLNAAPADSRVSSVLDRVDVLVVNEVEAEQLLGLTEFSPRDVAEARRQLAGDLVVTLGERGAVAADREGLSRRVPGLVVDAIDTVGAGDAFVGGLAAALADGAGLFDAIALANAAGAHTATVVGARHSDLDRLVAESMAGAV